MKFSMNGALTIGTLDGANVEIREEVGAENFFLFGLTAEEVLRRKAARLPPRGTTTRPTPELREALDQIASRHFSRGDRELFRPLVDSLLGRDDYMLLADYRRLRGCQERVGAAYRRPRTTGPGMSILNVARMGKFSSDRSIREYCERIWQVTPLE